MAHFGKVWGRTTPLLVTPLIEVHEIFVQGPSECSLHKHNFKWNAFYLIDGYMEIHVKKNNYDLTDITALDPGEFTTVPPGEYHKFVVPEDIETTALEIYYLEPLKEDIIRENVGGIILEDNNRKKVSKRN